MPETLTFPNCKTAQYRSVHADMDAAARRLSEDHTGKYAVQSGTVESNVYQRTVDWPDEWFCGFHIMLDSLEELVTAREEYNAGWPTAPCHWHDCR